MSGRHCITDLFLKTRFEHFKTHSTLKLSVV